MKGAAHMLEQLTDGYIKDQDDPTNVALSRAFKHEGNAWSWYELPENEMRFKRFGAAMKASVACSQLKPYFTVSI